MTRRQDATAEGKRPREAFWDQASHDLRQPVQSLQLLSRVFARQDGDEALRQAAEHMRRVVDDLAQMHAALLRLMELECGGAPGRGPVAVGPLVEETLRSVAGGRGDALRAEGLDGSVEADAGSLAAILRGLLALALRHREGGEVVVHGRDGAEGLTISIGFAGEGIPPEESGAVFLESAGPEGRAMVLGPLYLARLCGLLGYRLELGAGRDGRQRYGLTLPRAG